MTKAKGAAAPKAIKAKHTFRIPGLLRLAFGEKHVVGLGTRNVLHVLNPLKGKARKLKPRRFKDEVYSCAVSPDGKLAALVFEHNAIVLIDLVRDTDVRTIAGPFRSALFIDDKTLWAITSPDDASCEWRSYTMGSKAEPVTVSFEDPLCASGISVFRHPSARAMFVYIGGGQDGQMLLVAQELTKKREVTTVFDAQDGLGYPVLHPSGQELLIAMEGSLSRWQLPEVKLVRDFAAEGNESVEYVEYADVGHALALTEASELVRFDLETGEQVGAPTLDVPGSMTRLHRFDAELAISTHAGKKGDGLLAVWPLGRIEAKPAKTGKAAKTAKTEKAKPPAMAQAKSVATPRKKAPLTEKWRSKAQNTPAVQKVRQAFGAVIERYGEEAFVALTIKHHSAIANYFKPAAALVQAIRDGYTWPSYETIEVLDSAGESDTARDLALAVISCSDLHVDEELVMFSLRLLIGRKDAESLRTALPFAFRQWYHPQGSRLELEKAKCPQRIALILEYLEANAPLAPAPPTWPKLDDAAMRAARARKDPWVVITKPFKYVPAELRADAMYRMYGEASASEKKRIVALARTMFERAVDEEGRQYAAEALVRIGDYAPLLDHLDDADPLVRVRAGRALVQKEKAKGFPRAFADCEYDVKREVVREMLMVDPNWLYDHLSPLLERGGKVADENLVAVQALMHGLAWSVHRSVPRSWNKDEPRWKGFAASVLKAKIHGTTAFAKEIRSAAR